MPAAAPNVDILFGGDEVPDDHLQSYTIERDMFQPDMASVVLTNQNDIYSGKAVGDEIEIKVGSSPKSIFKGEIVGLEPSYKGGGKTTILIRAVNKMHMLLRKRQSLTFTDKTDEQILKQVVSSAGLNLKWKHEKTITYKHVYQHNQTDLEFLRMRAARLGCHVWCVGDDIMCQFPDLNASSGIKLAVDKDGDVQLRSFSPRLSSAGIVKKVTVKGWNPETKELITGEATAKSSPLGSKNAKSASGKHGNEDSFQVDSPIWSKEEADALAMGRLSDLSLTYMTGEAEVTGNAEFDLGKTVEIQANASGKDPFNGKYYIMGLTHRHTIPKANDGGYVTHLKLARDAEGG
jgi:phage protein D